MKNSFLRKIITILSLVMLLALVAVAFSGCGEDAGSEDNYESSADKVEAEAIAVLEDHFEALEMGDYEMLLEVLPPDIICDDVYYGNMEYYEETEEMRQTAITSFREYRDDFASWYGDDFKIDYTIEKTESLTSEFVIDLVDSGAFHDRDYAQFFMTYADEYYSPVFSEIESIQEISILTGTITLTGELDKSDEISFEACLIKYKDQWYYVGRDNSNVPDGHWHWMWF